MPIGSSAGATRVRASVSASTSTAAPPRAEPASTLLWSGPATSRTRCGTTSPKKPMLPATATLAPTASVLSPMSWRLSRVTGSPRCVACSSPNDNRFRGLPRRGSPSSGPARNGSSPPTTGHDAPPRLPSPQNVTERSCSSVAA